MRDLVALAFLLACIPLAWGSPLVSYLLWGWAGLIALNVYLYSFMSGVPFSQIFAIMTLLGLLLWPDRNRPAWQWNATAVAMVVFLGHGLMVALLAFPGLERNWSLYSDLSKTILFCLLMPLLLTTRERLHALVMMIALAVGFHGALDGLKFLVSGGGHKLVELEKFGDNNQQALVLLMAMPLIYYLFSQAKNVLMRWGFAAGMLTTALAVASAHSRGALLGLLVVGAWIAVRSPRRWMGLIVVGIGALLILELAPQRWFERMETLQTAGDDASFMGRVAAWKVSSAIALQHPIWGGGFRAVQSGEVWNAYVSAPSLLDFVSTPLLNRSGVAAHSIWFEVLGDQGFVGLFAFIAILIAGLATRRQVLRLASALGASAKWAADLANLLGLSLIVYMISGSALSAAYFEMPYIFIMMLEVLRQQLIRQSVALQSARKGGS